MKASRSASWIASLAVAVAVAGAVLPAAAQSDSKDLKTLMGENFAGLQAILVALVTANYAPVPDQVKLIQDHASHLTAMVPDDASEADRTRFLSYAYNLRIHAQDLESIIQALMEHDKGKEHLANDELREAAAAHYGGMVTMCVACHNRFRPDVVR